MSSKITENYSETTLGVWRSLRPKSTRKESKEIFFVALQYQPKQAKPAGKAKP